MEKNGNKEVERDGERKRDGNTWRRRKRGRERNKDK
jgi:hypothetical protein